MKIPYSFLELSVHQITQLERWQGNEGLKTVGNKAVKDYHKSSCSAIGGNPLSENGIIGLP